VECLDVGEGGARWRMLASMSTPRSSHTCEVMDGLIYVVGGGDGKDWLCSAEVNIAHKRRSLTTWKTNVVIRNYCACFWHLKFGNFYVPLYFGERIFCKFNKQKNCGKWFTKVTK
jgi:hypothetical protein